MIYLPIMPNFWIYLVLLAFYLVGCVSDSVLNDLDPHLVSSRSRSRFLAGTRSDWRFLVGFGSKFI